MIDSNAYSSFTGEKTGTAGGIPQARCPAAGSLLRALNRAVEIAFMEFRIPGDRPPVIGVDCLSIESSWKGVVTSVLSRTGPLRRRTQRLRLLFKSCKRLFDAACPPCDKKMASKARASWDRHVGEDVSSEALDRCSASVPLLMERVRELSSGWGRRLREERVEGGVPTLGDYVPDQQGCYEVPFGDGGTLACARNEYSGDRSLVRRGVAKTKGKHRVVTMQSAEVKRVLTPVHNALYNHISSFGWCVRGDIMKGDFEKVLGDLRDGEWIISGDYSSATDNIYLPAVEAIIKVLLECPELTALEREVLRESFCDLRWCNPLIGVQHPIKRGSMMGNLVSFPLLCLLNKACFDMSCDIYSDGREKTVRIGRFNGDDCCFCGDARFFEIWREVTSRFGLVVNEEKTGRSRRWMEMNSSIYDALKHRFVAKPVLSFLRPSRYQPGTILPDVLRGISSFRWSVQQIIVKVWMRYEICLRGVSAGLSEISPRWMSELLKCRWFRSACLDDAPPSNETGVNRDLPTSVGPPPDSRAYGFITMAAAELSRDRTELWTGVRVKPHVVTLDRQAYRNRPRLRSPRLSSRFERGEWEWRFVWPTELLSFVKERFPEVLRTSSRGRWIDDHPFLSRRRVFYETRSVTHPWKNPAFASRFCTDYPLGYQ